VSSGKVELTSSGAGTFDVDFPRYAMSLSNLVTEAGGTVHALDVSADVTLGPDKEAGGFELTGITLTVRGEVEGLNEAGCPISKALAGVEITLDAALEG
jgi:osmotically inducible protein OsmC